MTQWKERIQSYDERHDLVIARDTEAAIAFAVEQFIEIAQEAIQRHGSFAVALSGGSTPKAIYEALALPENSSRIDWKRVMLFWSDERAVSKDSPESNYRMAMSAGFETLPIPPENIHRMEADNDIEESAKVYDKLIGATVPQKKFDLVMLGMGDDGHTASLFPKTHGLHTNERLAIANYIPQKNTWRMTLTYDCINSAHNIVVYVLGKGKAAMLKSVIAVNSHYDPDTYPIQRIGTPSNKALFVLDKDAAEHLLVNGNGHN